MPSSRRHTRVTSHASRSEGGAGFSFVELLAVIAIMSLVSAVMATGIPSAYNAFLRTVDSANAHIVLGTTTTLLRDELSVADTSESVPYIAEVSTLSVIDPHAIELGPDPESGAYGTTDMTVLTSYMSTRSGYLTFIVRDETGRLYKVEYLVDPLHPKDVSKMSPAITKDAAGKAVAQRIVSEAASKGSRNELIATLDGIAYDGTEHVFSISGLRVVKEDVATAIGEAQAASFTVRPISSS